MLFQLCKLNHGPIWTAHFPHETPPVKPRRTTGSRLLSVFAPPKKIFGVVRGLPGVSMGGPKKQQFAKRILRRLRGKDSQEVPNGAGAGNFLLKGDLLEFESKIHQNYT